MKKLLSILCIVSIISSMTIVPTFAEELDKISINIKENTQNGEKELKEGTVGVRSRKQGDIGQIKSEEFIEKIINEVKNFKRD